MPRTVFPPSAIITAVSVSTRPRSWPGVNPSRCSTRDRAVVRPVRSAVSRNAAAPACAITASPSAVTVKPLDHPVESFTRKVPLDMGLIWTSQPGFSQIGGTFHCPQTTLSQQDRETLRYGDSAYGTGEARDAYRDAGHDVVIKPKPLPSAVPDGFTLDDFTIDENDGTVTCPNGNTRPMSPARTVTFGRLCADCPLRQRCTTAKTGRST